MVELDYRALGGCCISQVSCVGSLKGEPSALIRLDRGGCGGPSIHKSEAQSCMNSPDQYDAVYC